MMAASTFNTGTAALGWCVIDGEELVLPGYDAATEVAKQDAGKDVGLVTSDAAQQSVGAAEVFSDAAGAEPGGGCASAVSEKNAEKQRLEQFGVACVE
jgi:hypothetical protein